MSSVRFWSVWCLGERKQTQLGFPLLYSEISPMWVGLLHVSISLLQNLLPLTFRPTPHTLLAQRMLHAGGHSDRHSPWLMGISPGAVHMLYIYIYIGVFACLSTSRGLPELQSEEEEQSWQWIFKKQVIKKCLGSCVCLSVLVCMCCSIWGSQVHFISI